MESCAYAGFTFSTIVATVPGNFLLADGQTDSGIGELAAGMEPFEWLEGQRCVRHEKSDAVVVAKWQQHENLATKARRNTY